MRIGIDIMGGDYAPDAILKGAILAKKDLSPSEELVFFGPEKEINNFLEQAGIPANNFEIIHTQDVILMADNPTKAFQNKPDSGIHKGLKMLKEGVLDGYCSAGNTGTIYVGALKTIKPLRGVIRPCLASPYPNMSGGNNIILDVGINADIKPDVLYQYGLLGSIYAKLINHLDNPRVGLLNIGKEESKGNLVSKHAFELMQDATEFNFVGNIEGNELSNNDIADVIVCDGFTGNVVIKQAESFYNIIRERGIEDNYFRRFNFETYGGLPLLGLDANVVIGHGISTPAAIKNMILLTRDITKAQLSEKIKTSFNHE